MFPINDRLIIVHWIAPATGDDDIKVKKTILRLSVGYSRFDNRNN